MMIQQHQWNPAKAVQRGIEFLDHKKRGWRKKVDPAKIKFTPRLHPLGQIFGSFDAGLYWLVSKARMPTFLGFTEPWYTLDRAAARQELMEQWIKQLSP